MKATEPYRRALLVGLLLLLPMGAARAGEAAKTEPTALTTFRAEVEKLLLAWKGILRETAPLRKRLETARATCRQDERVSKPTPAQRTWRAGWDATADDRMRLHNKIFPHFLKWSAPLHVLFEAHDTRPLTAQTLAQVSLVAADRVRAWLAVGEVGTLRGLLETAPGGMLRALAQRGRPPPRRKLLAAVAERAAATPGTSDLGALCATVTWAGLFAAARKPAAQLDLVSGDLVVMLTERKEDGLAMNDGRYYEAGRFRDRGFAAQFRDGSDQVRHFAWAFRMFATSEEPAATTRLLRAKEIVDARSRKHPLNEADLSLNAAARGLVATIQGRKGGDTPVGVREWPALFAARLGSPPRSRAVR